MKGYTRSIIFLFVCALNIFAGSKDTLSTQEIFRPLILPKGMWQLYANKNFRFNFSGDYKNTHGAFNLSTFLAAHSFSDRFMMSNFPLPYLMFRISKYDILDKSNNWIKKPSVVLGFGIPAINNISVDGTIQVPINFSITIKKLLSEKYFYYGYVMSGLTLAGSYRPIGYFGTVENGLGVQLVEKVCLKISYDFLLYNKSSNPYHFESGILFQSHRIPITLIINVNRSISINLGTGIYLTQNMTDDKLYLVWPVSTGFQCQW